MSQIKTARVIKTEELERKKYLGTLTEKEAQLLERRHLHEAEINNKALYQQYFKDYCVRCEAIIPKTWHHYKDHGNYCTACYAYFGRLMQGKY